MTRRHHRLFGALLSIPLILWMVTGLLFHLKFRYDEAFETLQVPVSITSGHWKVATVAPADLAALGLDLSKPFKLMLHPSGQAAYVGSASGNPIAIDAASGTRLPAAAETEVRAWATAAVNASPHSNHYGQPMNIRETLLFSGATGLQHPAFEIDFSGGKRVTVDRITGEISQTGELNRWIDFTYRIHYLQWTPWQPVNIALVLLAVPLVLLLALSGLRLFFGRTGK